LYVFFHYLSSVHSSLTALRLPIASATGPVGLPQLLIGVDTSDAFLHIFA
jgi:hypothetical protein